MTTTSPNGDQFSTYSFTQRFCSRSSYLKITSRLKRETRGIFSIHSGPTGSFLAPLYIVLTKIRANEKFTGETAPNNCGDNMRQLHQAKFRSVYFSSFDTTVTGEDWGFIVGIIGRGLATGVYRYIYPQNQSTLQIFMWLLVVFFSL